MKKYKLKSLIHQFYKNLIYAKENGYSIFPLLRFLPKYLIQNRFKRDRLEMGLPWLVYDVVEYLDSNIFSGQVVFEFGAGASSHYFLKKSLNLVSVEHDRVWYEKISTFLKEKKFNDFCLNLVEPVNVAPNLPRITSVRDKRFIGFDYYEYSSLINRYPDSYFDIVLVDGRVRAECLRNSIRKVKKNGIIILDNSERHDYKDVVDSLNLNVVLKKFGLVQYELGFTETTVFRV